MENNERLPQEIVSYQDFLFWIGDKPDIHKQKHARRLNSLREAIGENDPIEYLHVLYYADKKSLHEICKEVSKYNIEFFPKASLHRLLFEKFGWTPRKNTDRTPVHEQKLSQEMAMRLDKVSAEVKKIISEPRKTKVFSMEKYLSQGYRIDRALYLLESLSGLDFKQVLDLLFKKEIPDADIALYVNQELDKIINGIPELGIRKEDVSVYPQCIFRRKKYHFDKSVQEK